MGDGTLSLSCIRAEVRSNVVEFYSGKDEAERSKPFIGPKHARLQSARRPSLVDWLVLFYKNLGNMQTQKGEREKKSKADFVNDLFCRTK